MTNDRAKREAFEKWCNMQQNEPQVATYAHEFMEQEWRAYQAGYKAARTFTQEDVENVRYAISQSDCYADCEDKAKAALSAIGEVK